MTERKRIHIPDIDDVEIVDSRMNSHTRFKALQASKSNQVETRLDTNAYSETVSKNSEQSQRIVSASCSNVLRNVSEGEVIQKSGSSDTQPLHAKPSVSTNVMSNNPSTAGPTSEAEPIVQKQPLWKSNCILVKGNQRGNPILKFIRNVPLEYNDQIPDYIVSPTICALFLSLRYHLLKPDYIHERLKQLGHQFQLRILLVQVDVKDPHHCIKQLTKIAILADCTLLLAWSPEEAGRYLETYKIFENKPPDVLMEKQEDNPVSKLVDALTSIKSVNRTDAKTLLSTFKSFKNIAEAGEEQMSFCPGIGPQKAKKLHLAFQEPFKKMEDQT